MTKDQKLIIDHLSAAAVSLGTAAEIVQADPAIRIGQVRIKLAAAREGIERAAMLLDSVQINQTFRSHVAQRCKIPVAWGGLLILTASICFADIAKPAPKFIGTNAPARKGFQRCTGAADCQACTSCVGCAHCHKNGGTCGKRKGGAK